MPDLVNKKEESPESIWRKLTRLFRSGPIVRHKIAAGERLMEPKGTARAYKKELNALYINSLASYGQYERLARYGDFCEMEFCLSGDTLIATPCGYKMIRDLATEYGSDKEFLVYSYDHDRGELVPAVGKQARMTRRDVAWRVKFDNDKEIVGSADHRLMLRDGSYKKICELVAGDSMMPFYRRSWWSPNGEHDDKHYQAVYTGKRWIAEHRLIAKHMIGRPLTEGEVVHHRNFVKSDNSPQNLCVMTDEEHRRYHVEILNKKKWDVSTNSEWIEKFRADHSKFMTEHNPSARLDVTFGLILQAAEACDFNEAVVSKMLDVDVPTIIRRLKAKGFKNWVLFARSYDPEWRNHGWDNAAEKNPRWDDSLSYQMVCDAYESGITPVKLLQKLCAGNQDITFAKIKSRVKQGGFTSTADFCKNYRNCKVVSVELVGEMDLYDLTVDGYKNFATDSVISHNTPEIASALNIYSDETCVQGEDGHVMKVRSKSDEIKSILETLFFDIIGVDHSLWYWIRNLCKFGDTALFVDASDTNGILNLMPIPINEIEREEGYDKDNPFATRFRWLTQGNMILQNWQVIHFRMLGNDAYLPYGSSIIEPARRIWRQLILIEDAMLVYRIVRSPERRVFKIPVGNIAPDEIDRHVEEIKNKLKRTSVVDSSTGRVDLRYNALSVDEDYFLPYRGNEGPTIETLPGGQFTGDIEDVQYIQSKLFAALGIPKSYLGFEGDIGSKATLAQEDIRFAKAIERIQKIVVAELNKIAIIHLYLLGYKGDDLCDFELSMANPSTIAEQQKLELWRMKLEVASIAQEGMFDRGTIYKRIFGFSKKDIDSINEGKRFDKIEDAKIARIEQVLGAQQGQGGDLGLGGGGGGGGLGGGLGDLGGLGGPPGGGGMPGESELPPSLGMESVDIDALLITEVSGKRRSKPGNPGRSPIPDTGSIFLSKGQDVFSVDEDQSSSKLEDIFGDERKEYENESLAKLYSDDELCSD
jgi:hypothetical protein